MVVSSNMPCLTVCSQVSGSLKPCISLGLQMNFSHVLEIAELFNVLRFFQICYATG